MGSDPITREFTPQENFEIIYGPEPMDTLGFTLFNDDPITEATPNCNEVVTGSDPITNCNENVKGSDPITSRCKIKVGKIFIVAHGEDEESPFVIHDVTKEAKGRAKWVNDNIWDLNRMQKQPEEVDIYPGEQCREPYECWYYGYCHGESIDKN